MLKQPAPYKCCAWRTDGSRSFTCSGLMSARKRTLEYDGDLYVEVRCDKCGRTAYAPIKETDK